MANPRSRAVLGGGAVQSKRVPVTQKDDKHMQHGQLLLSLQQAPSSLERLLAVTKLSVTLLADLMRRSDDTQDIPLLLLGHHYLSHRVLGDPKAGTATSSPPAGAASQPSAAAAAGSATPQPRTAAAAGSDAHDIWRAYVQELCTFDRQEGPKAYVDAQGAPKVTFALSLEPTAIAKAKRLGRELSIKVTLQEPAGSSGSNAGSSGSSIRLVECGEEFAISWPSLLFLNPVSPACRLAYKGGLDISCPQSGLSLSLTFAKDHSVKGTIEQLKLSKPTPNDAAAEAGAVLGALEGSWIGVINATCPQLGLEGVVYDVSAVSPAPVPSVDLRHMGPMKLSRFWSAVHDALLYADPRAATGGRAAAKLASTMGHYLTALTLDSAAARDVGAGPSSRTGPGSTAGLSKGAPSVASVGTDPDLDEFDRQAEGLSAGKVDANQDTREVPPCYKEQHAAGNKLRYQLHYTLTQT